jgi:hypothetical protein
MSYTTKFHGILIFVHLKPRSSCWLCYTAISIKVVHEQSGKVECERERLLGIANKLMIWIFKAIPSSLSRSYLTFPLCLYMDNLNWNSCISLTQNAWSAQEIKTSHGSHIQDLKTDFRCHGHDLRSTKNSRTLFRTNCEFFYKTIDKFSNLSHSNPEIKFGPTIFFLKRSNPGILGSKVYMTF